MKISNAKKQANEAYVEMKFLYIRLKEDLKEANVQYEKVVDEITVSDLKLNKLNKEIAERHKKNKSEVLKKYSELLREAKHKDDGEANKENISKIRNKRDIELKSLSETFLKDKVQNIESNLKKDSELSKKYDSKKKILVDLEGSILKIDKFFNEIYQMAEKILPAEVLNKPRKRKKKEEPKKELKAAKELIPVSA